MTSVAEETDKAAAQIAASTAGLADHAGAGCLNCGAHLLGAYCHRCGQSAHVHTTIASVGHDLAHGLFHFEGRIWRTLPMLALRPGQLTRRYIAGERARFVSPLALFLFGVLLLFAAIESLGPPLRLHINIQHKGRTITPDQLRHMIAADRQVIARDMAAGRAIAGTGAARAAADRALADERADLTQLERAQRIVDSLERPTVAVSGHVNTGWTGLDARIAGARANPSLALVQVEGNAHKFAWALIPLSLPFVWLVFWWRREWRLYDHVVFVTYSQSAAILLLVAMAAIGATGLEVSWLLALAPIHIFVQLRGAYRLGWWAAAWRTMWLTAAAVLTLAGFAVLVLWLGVG